MVRQWCGLQEVPESITFRWTLQDRSCLVLPYSALSCPALSYPVSRSTVLSGHLSIIPTLPQSLRVALPLCAYWAPSSHIFSIRTLFRSPLSLSLTLHSCCIYTTPLAGVSIDGYLIPVEQNGIEMSNNNLKVIQTAAHILLSSFHLLRYHAYYSRIKSDHELHFSITLDELLPSVRTAFSIHSSTLSIHLSVPR